MKENFSKRVQTIMKFAKEEAIQLGHSYVGSEHLMLGIIREGSGKAVQLLEQLRCDLEEMRVMIEDMVKPSGGTMTLGHLPLTRRAERILRNTFIEASNLGASHAEDFHLLLAILQEKEGVAYEVLSAYEVDYEAIFELLKQEDVLSEEKKNQFRILNPLPLLLIISVVMLLSWLDKINWIPSLDEWMKLSV